MKKSTVKKAQARNRRTDPLQKLEKKVTQGFQKVDERFSTIDDQFKHVLEYVDAKFKDSREDTDRKHEETLRHFSLIAEQNRNDMLTMSGDRTAQHTDRLENHEKRITKVEKAVGLAA